LFIRTRIPGVVNIVAQRNTSRRKVNYAHINRELGAGAERIRNKCRNNGTFGHSKVTTFKIIL